MDNNIGSQLPILYVKPFLALTDDSQMSFPNSWCRLQLDPKWVQPGI